MHDPDEGEDDNPFEEHELEYSYDEAPRRRIGNERRKTTGVVRKQAQVLTRLVGLSS